MPGPLFSADESAAGELGVAADEAVCSLLDGVQQVRAWAISYSFEPVTAPEP
jgi:hypothetical protein